MRIGSSSLSPEHLHLEWQRDRATPSPHTRILFANASLHHDHQMIDKLEMLIALARERHFGRAAETCHVTQPTLSSAIKSLEEQLGVQLVQRGARFIGLTPEGERVLARAKAIVAEARALKSDVAVAREGLSGTLRLGVIPTALASVHDLTRPFLDEHPGVRMRILSLNSHEILNRLAEFEIDAGLSYSHADHAEVNTVGEPLTGQQGQEYQQITASGADDRVVYTVAGSAGQASGMTGRHPAHVYSESLLGSVVVDAGKDRLVARFIDVNGESLDYFTITK